MSASQVASAAELLEDPPMPFADHLVELRRRLIWGLAILGAGACLVFQFSDLFLDWLARPVGGLVFIAPAEAFQTRLRLALFGGLLLTLPLLLHQVWLFVARAVARPWRRRLLMMLPLAYLLFLSGVALCLLVVMPAAMGFFLSYGSPGVRPLIGLGEYLRFVEALALAFGAVFEFPLVLYVLNRMGIVQKSQLAPHRRLIYFACVVLSAVLSAEVVGQVSLAACTIVLFELSLLAMRPA